jgi:hypothetical protein
VLVIGPGVYERNSATLSAELRSCFSYGVPTVFKMVNFTCSRETPRIH